MFYISDSRLNSPFLMAPVPAYLYLLSLSETLLYFTVGSVSFIIVDYLCCMLLHQLNFEERVPASGLLQLYPYFSTFKSISIN